ncbi:MAG: cysteine desulfurase [Flavobacteriales bacterium]|nr:cysteine desulfurase [Flavobacteriales bacterium]
MRVYLDNAATTPLDPEVVNSMTDVLSNYYGNPSAQHSIGRSAKGILETSRRKIAEIIGASSSEIIFTSGGTEADNLAIRCSVNDLGIQNIITSPIEHHAVLSTIEELDAKGLAKHHLVNISAKGEIDLAHLEELASKYPGSLICIMHANNELGTMADLKAISEIAKKHNCLFHSDTVQTMGHFDIKVNEIGLDFLACSAHKFNGPKGVGFLYIRNNHKLKPLFTGGGQEKNMRAGTENIPGIVGLAKALEVSTAIMKEKREKLMALKSLMMELIQNEIPGVTFNGVTDPDKSLYTVLNVSIPENNANEMLLFKLDIEGVCASGGSACSSGASKGSHVLAAINHPEERTGLRFSFGKYTTEDEIRYAVEKLKKVLSE